MNNLDMEILKFVNKVSKRIKFNFLIDKVLMGLNASLVLIFIILSVSLFWTIEYTYELSVISIILIIISCIIRGIITSPKRNEISLIVDLKGLEERVTTSLEYLGDNSKIAEAQKRDTIKNIKEFDIKNNIPIVINKRKILKIIILIIVCLVVIIIPTKAKKETVKLKNFKNIKNEIVNKIEKEEKDIVKENSLSDEEKEQLKKILKEAKEELKETNKNEELNKLIERINKKIEKVKEQSVNEENRNVLNKINENLTGDYESKNKTNALHDLNEINKKLKDSKQGQELLELIKTGNESNIENKLNEINENLSKLSDVEKSKLSNALSDAAVNLNEEELQKLLQNASDDILNGEISNAEELAASLARLSLTAGISQNNSDNNKNQQNSSVVNSQGSGKNNAFGNNGSGGKGNGPGWNTGSKDGIENNDIVKEGEQIFVPGRKEGNDEKLLGKSNGYGIAQNIETEKGLNLNGQKVQYDTVIGDYSKEEIESMEKTSMPENLQKVVKDYFNDLE